MAEFLYCQPKTITTVLTGCAGGATVQGLKVGMTERPHAHIREKRRMEALSGAHSPICVLFLWARTQPIIVGAGKSPQEEESGGGEEMGDGLREESPGRVAPGGRRQGHRDSAHQTRGKCMGPQHMLPAQNH